MTCGVPLCHAPDPESVGPHARCANKSKTKTTNVKQRFSYPSNYKILTKCTKNKKILKSLV